MAVGQLLDYAYQGRLSLGMSTLAILLPKRPEEKVEKWLRYLNISVIWQTKDGFKDNANGKFV